MSDDLAGKRVLIVEDEYFVAADITRALRQEGVTVVGPVGDLARGLALLDEGIDAAILDINLAGSNSLPIAERLTLDAIPYVFLTGYDADAIPEPFRGAPRLLKPFNMTLVVQMIRDLVAPAVSA